MMATLARNWWALVLRGIFAILFGLIAFVWPGATIVSLTAVFGFYALLDGTFAIVAAWSQRRSGRGRVFLAEGLLGLAAGVMALMLSGVTAMVLLSIIAAWVISTGLLEIVTAIRLHQEIENEWLLGLGWLVLVIFGVFVVIWPGSGLVALTWLFGAYAIAFGILMLMFGFRLHGLDNSGRHRVRSFRPGRQW